MKKPIILDYATKRETEPNNEFTYDYNLNVIKEKGEKKVFIETKREILEFMTKTCEVRERDDT